MYPLHLIVWALACLFTSLSEWAFVLCNHSHAFWEARAGRPALLLRLCLLPHAWSLAKLVRFLIHRCEAWLCGCNCYSSCCCCLCFGLSRSASYSISARSAAGSGLVLVGCLTVSTLQAAAATLEFSRAPREELGKGGCIPAARAETLDHSSPLSSSFVATLRTLTPSSSHRSFYC